MFLKFTMYITSEPLITTWRVRTRPGSRPVSTSAIIWWRRSSSRELIPVLTTAPSPASSVRWTAIVFPVIISSSPLITAIIVVSSARTATIGWSSHINPWCRGMRPFSYWEINSYPSSIQFHAIGTFLCLFCIVHIFKIYKRESSGSSRLLIINNRNISYGTVFWKHFS